jgi:hypothetical protein
MGIFDPSFSDSRALNATRRTAIRTAIARQIAAGEVPHVTIDAYDLVKVVDVATGSESLVSIAEINGEATAVIGTVNVKAAGARGDNSTDDTVAIQTAIDNSLPGDTIYFPPGVYRTSSPILLREQRTYKGAWASRWPYTPNYTSPKNTVIKALGSFTGDAVFAIRDNTITGRSLFANGIRVYDLAADASATSSTTCFRVEGLCRDIRFERCVAENGQTTSLAGFDFDDGAGEGFPRGIVMVSNVAWSNDGHGFKYTNVTDSFFQDNLAVDNDGTGIEWVAPGENTVIGDRAVFNNGDGIVISGTVTVGLSTYISIGTDRNDHNGIVVSATGTTQPIQLVAPRVRRDGAAATDQNYTGILVTGTAPVDIVSPNVLVGVNDGGGGNESPQHGIRFVGISRAHVFGGEVWGVSTGLSLSGSNTSIEFDGTRWFNGAVGARTAYFPDVIQGKTKTFTLLGAPETWTNMAAAEQPFVNSTSRYMMVDLTNHNYVRYDCGVTVQGSSGSVVYLQYTTDLTGASGWTKLNTTDTSLVGTGYKGGAWDVIPTAAKGLVLVRIAGQGGDGAADPVIARLGVLARP